MKPHGHRTKKMKVKTMPTDHKKVSGGLTEALQKEEARPSSRPIVKPKSNLDREGC